jgi:predicted lipid carrier protein YhbT
MSYAESCLAHYVTLPIQLIPQDMRNYAVAQVLTNVFSKELLQGELNFLENRHVKITVNDAAFDMRITLVRGKIQAGTENVQPDLTVSGSVYDFLLLMTGREDPDTLFFQRRLCMHGNTGLGVHLKNFLASVDPKTLPLGNLVQPALHRGLDWYEWWM